MTYTTTPATSPKYTYVGYKKRQDKLIDASVEMVKTVPASNPPTINYDASFDTYYLNLYYTKAPDAVVHVKHFNVDGSSLDSVFGDQDIPVYKNDSVPLEHPDNSSYTYQGYKKTTTGTPPSKSPPYTAGDFGTLTFSGGFTEMYMYYFYAPVGGEVRVRHMVRPSATGSFVQQKEETIAVPALPGSKTISADTKYGKAVGSSVSYSSYSDTVGSGTGVTANLTSTNKIAYVSLFYEDANAKKVTGDFDIVPDQITYRDSFTLHPKNIQVNGCTYQYHYFKITKDGFTAATDKVYGMTKDLVITESKYPYSLGVGTNDVTMIVVADCETSDPIGPKTLEVLGPSNNSPPEFEVGFVYPYAKTEPVYTVVVGTTMDLIYITDPSVPTPTDPDGDDYYFDGFDFSNSSEWAQQIPVQYANREYIDGFHGITMEELGIHRVTAKMHDKWGASTTATTYINVVPPNPVAIIDGPITVTEGRPLPEAFSAARSYSPMNRKINHTRDEWTNKKDIYDTPGNELITLSVYDSAGLKSLEPARHTLTVKPDLAPLPVLNFASPTVRSAAVTFQERSYSPDHDQIVQKDIWYQYDKDNDGNYDEETKVPITLNSDQNFSLTSNRVGKYRFSIYLKEDWGKEAQKSWILDVVNDGPTVNFDISSESKEPTVIPSIPLSAATLVSSPAWMNNDLEGSVAKRWSVNPVTGALVHNVFGSSGSPLGPVQTDLTVTRLARSNKLAAMPHLLDDGLAHTYYNSEANSGSKPGYDVSLLDANGSYISTSVRSGEALDFYDSHTQTAYTHKTVNGVTQYYSYTKAEFAATGGTVKLITSLPESPTIDLPSTAYGAVSPSTTVSGTTTSYWFTPVSWASGQTEGTKWGVSAEAYSAMNYGDPDLNFVKHYYNATNKTYYKYDSRTNTLTSFTNKFMPYNVTTSPYMNGKYTITMSSINSPKGMSVYDTTTGERTDYLAETIDSFFHDIILADGGNAAYNVTDEGKFKLLWQNAYTLTKQTDIDSEGYFYVTEAKSVYRIQVRNGYRNFVYDLTGIWKDDYRTSETNVNRYKRTFYIDFDGALTMFQAYNRSDDGSQSGKEAYFLVSPRNYASVNHADLQQLLGDKTLQNAQFNFKVRMNDFPYFTEDRYVGFGFHAADSRNMYRVELNLNGIRLMKVENGIRTPLATVDYPLDRRSLYTVRIQVLDGRMRVYLNNVPVIDLMDHTFEKGRFGPFSEIPTTEFVNLAYSDLTAISSSAKLQGIVIVDDEMIYTITNEDTENDPMISDLTRWRYDHLSQKFLNAGDGKSGNSAYDGKTYTTPLTLLDEVGLYQVSYGTKDDANPDYPFPASDFEDYRKNSNLVIRQLIVHRRPIVDYDIGFDTDQMIKWTDRSHDPDRYLSGTNYSTEDTGIDYLATKGILQKKFYYITPSGLTVDQKLVVPDETGEYTVGLAVKDEYDAWSSFLEKKITVSKIPQPDDPPKAGFTLSSITTYRGVPVTMDSTASDNEDGGRENLPHQYYIRGLNPAGYETLQSAVRTSWQKTFSAMGTFQIRQVVEDSKGQTAEAVRTIEIVNRAPAAQVTIPSSPDQNTPDKLTELRPEFRWFYADNDGDAMIKYQVRVYLYGGILEQDSGIMSGSSRTWIPEADLPEKVNMYVIVRAYDGYDWSVWSEPRFFYVETNQPPTADFDWSPKPVYEGDQLAIIHSLTDPDQDDLTVSYAITDPDGYTATRSYSLTSPYPTAGPSWQAIKPGTYNVTLTAKDRQMAEAAVTKTIQVLPLQITGQVKHTATWDEKRRAYNLASSGSENNPRTASTFWAGEKFQLQAQTTSTGTSMRADRVEVAMGGFQTSLTASDTARTQWSGELWDESLGDLADGPITFVFTAYYSNGTIKTTPVTVSIAGNTGQTYGVHRRQ